MKTIYKSALLTVVFAFGQLAHPLNAALAEEKAVEGMLVVDLDDDGNVQTASITTDDGVKYSLKLDDAMKKLGKDLRGKKVEVSGEMTEQDEVKTIAATKLKAKAE